jgi:hypothetical protein
MRTISRTDLVFAPGGGRRESAKCAWALTSAVIYGGMVASLLTQRRDVDYVAICSYFDKWRYTLCKHKHQQALSAFDFPAI